MSTSRDLTKRHRTRLKNCKGAIKGDTSNLDPNMFLTWVPELSKWLTPIDVFEHDAFV